MNPKLLHCKNVIEVLKSDFGALWNCRARGNSIEVITPFSTVTQKFVSVFITIREDSFIVTDGGWLSNEQDFYDLDELEEDAAFDAVLEHFAGCFKVSSVKNRDGKFFFKKCSEEKLLSNAVYDLANFVSSVVNNLSIPNQAETEHRETFRKEANGFIQQRFPNARFGHHPLDDYKTAIFHAVIIYPAQFSLVAYITGSRHSYFVNQFQRAVVNFECAAQSKYQKMIKGRVALINNAAEGYSPNSVTELSPLIAKYNAKTVTWTDKEAALSDL